MRVRLYIPGHGDAPALDRILGTDHDVLIGRDRLVVATDDADQVKGTMVWRPTAFIHEFHVPPVLAQRSVADDLMTQAIRLDFTRRHRIYTALFLVDSSNLAMLRYVRQLEGVAEQSGVLFTLPLKPSTSTAPGEPK